MDDTETAHRARGLAQMLRDALEAGVPGWLVNPVHACIIDLETMSTSRAGDPRSAAVLAQAETLVAMCRAIKAAGA